MTEQEVELTLLKLAHEANAKQPIPKAAIEAVLLRLEEDVVLAESVHEELCRRAVASAVYQDRHQAMTRTKANLPYYLTGGRSLEHLARTHAHAMESWIMPDGRALSVYHKSELLAAAEDCEQKADGFIRDAKLFRTIAGRMKSDRVAASSVMTSEEFLAMLRRTWGKEMPEKVAS